MAADQLDTLLQGGVAPGAVVVDQRDALGLLGRLRGQAQVHQLRQWAERQRSLAVGQQALLLLAVVQRQ
ncbi:hypothetical protein D3C81_1982770 [compost metagenome]